MRLGYIVALLMIVLMVGCATETQPEAPAAEPAPPAEEPPEAPVEPVAPPEEALPAEEPEEELSDANLEHIERLKPACERGSVQSCLVLKNTYGIDWPPEVVEEPEAEGEAGTEGGALE